MAVFLRYLGKYDLSTDKTFYMAQKQKHGHVYLVRLYDIVMWIRPSCTDLDLRFRKSRKLEFQIIVEHSRPDNHGRVVLVPCKSDACVCYCTAAYTGQVTFYKVPK